MSAKALEKNTSEIAYKLGTIYISLDVNQSTVIFAKSGIMELEKIITKGTSLKTQNIRERFY